MDIQNFKRALWEAGGVTAVARRINVARSTIYKWMDEESVPERHVPALLRETGLTRVDLGDRGAKRQPVDSA